MDYSEQEIDLFGDDDEIEKEKNNDEDDNSRNSSSSSSSLSSSSSGNASGGGSGSGSGSASGSGSGSGSGSDRDDEDEVDNKDIIGRRGFDEDDSKDLFGSDNEDYVRTLASSPFSVPTLPRIQNMNNPSRGRGGRWQSGFQNGRGGHGILPRPGSYNQRQGYGGYAGGRYQQVRDERFVSEMKFKTEETLSRKAITFQEPSELACYSRDEAGDVYFDDRSLRLFKRLISEDVGADLNQGFDTFIEKKDLGSEGFGDLLACIRAKKIPLGNNIHFVTYRNNLNKIMATAYVRHEPWEMGVHKRKGVVYLDVHKLPERPQSETDRRRCYWGYCFENLATEESRRGDGEGIHHVDANAEYCSVIKTKLGAHRILMGAEMDCCDATDDGRRFYIELKTSRELEYRTEERFERDKLLKFWIQSFLAGVPYIVIGYR
ncbi:hypothetical protein C5167_050005 [Papaver somniferum]|uniref:Decapping nuclease n=2 Tax=Papaver somniferum TaxID=3469 RepID=A0A4Y7KNT8_PAPSO|nr:hypothetical protein C5167_050005 [Papaver somniferum]